MNFQSIPIYLPNYTHIHTCTYIHDIHTYMYIHTYLYDEVADDAAVIGMHSRTESVENSGHTNFHTGLAFVCVPDMKVVRISIIRNFFRYKTKTVQGCKRYICMYVCIM